MGVPLARTAVIGGVRRLIAPDRYSTAVPRPGRWRGLLDGGKARKTRKNLGPRIRQWPDGVTGAIS
jgi:hypothetical protein